MSKIIQKFTNELLNNFISKYDASLLDNYENIKLTRDTNISFKCKCGNDSSKLFRYIVETSGATCKECCSINKQKKFEDICIKKYGAKHHMKTLEFENKRKNTNILKYGTDNPSHNINIIKKISDKLKSDEIKTKIKQTFLKNYGIENPYNNIEIIEKRIKTNLLKYGVEHISQNLEFQQKIQRNAFKYKSYKLPSGLDIKIQGFEHFALNDLLKKYKEEQIITDRFKIPRIEYIFNNKIKYYFPDIYIPSANLIIEVKSTWTYKCKYEITLAKSNATKNNGYLFELWIYDVKGNRVVA